MKIHIMGASGSGATTLGEALAHEVSFKHLDTDNYYWLSTTPPFMQKRSINERLALLKADVLAEKEVVVSGSLLDWGAEVEDIFDLIAFLYLPTELRLARLRQREVSRYGQVDPAFLEWAAQYDEGTAEGRSLAKHDAWLAKRKCPILRLEGDMTVAERVTNVMNAISHLPKQQAAYGGNSI